MSVFRCKIEDFSRFFGLIFLVRNEKADLLNFRNVKQVLCTQYGHSEKLSKDFSSLSYHSPLSMIKIRCVRAKKITF